MGKGEPQSGQTAVLIGGAALLMWLLLRGPGWRLGRGRASGDDADTARQPAGRPCRVHIDAAGIVLDGTRADLTTAVATCRGAGLAEVTATGAAIVGAIGEVLLKLRDAGVIVKASPDLWDVAGLAYPAGARHE